MDITRVFDSFCKKIKEREGFLSEDNVRFYWFASMLEQDAELNHYSLEEPYPSALKGKELDLMYEQGNTLFCFEIKFHRHPIPLDKNKKAFPHTMSAGELFNDILRLPKWQRTGKSIRRFLLYVTDHEMHRYLSKEGMGDAYREQLNRFYADDARVTKPKHIDILFEDMPATFEKSATAELEPASVRQEISLSLIHASCFPCNSCSIQRGGNCHVRLYEL